MKTQYMHRAGLIAAAVLLLISGCGPTSFVITPVPAEQALQETVLVRESVWAADKILLVDVDGILQNSRPQALLGLPGENPVALFKEELDKAARDGRVRAVVLRINSPGGTVTASDLMYYELLRFKQRTDKPVVACMLDVAASGGYYLACASDHIVAHPTTVTGSIGVIMMTPDLTGTMDKLGIGVHVFKSGPLKDAGSPFREMSDADRAMLQGLIDEMYARFLAVVRQGRPALTEEQVGALADGRVFLGPRALEVGLVDEVGTLPDAIVAAKRRAGLEGRAILLVEYSRPLSYRPNYYARTDGEGPATAPVRLNVGLPPWLAHSTPQMLYLWAPGW